MYSTASQYRNDQMPRAASIYAKPVNELQYKCSGSECSCSFKYGRSSYDQMQALQFSGGYQEPNLPVISSFPGWNK